MRWRRPGHATAFSIRSPAARAAVSPRICGAASPARSPTRPSPATRSSSRVTRPSSSASNARSRQRHGRRAEARRHELQQPPSSPRYVQGEASEVRRAVPPPGARDIACGHDRIPLAKPACLVLGGETAGDHSGGTGQQRPANPELGAGRRPSRWTATRCPMVRTACWSTVSPPTAPTARPTPPAASPGPTRSPAAAPWAWMPAPRWQITTATPISARWAISS